MVNRPLNAEEVCERYGISIWTLYQWTSKKVIPYFKRGGLKFREEDLSRWEEESLLSLPKVKLL